MNKILVAFATLAMSAVFALAGSGQAQADPGLCWNGWLWSACVQGPGWLKGSCRWWSAILDMGVGIGVTAQT